MSFTRFHDDPLRIQKQLQEQTFLGRYMLNVPGPGSNLPYMEDPQIRIQKWGANTYRDSTNLESDLFNLGRKLDHNYDRTYREGNISTAMPMSFPTNVHHVEESRASHPAWMYRDLEQGRWENPILNPLANLEKGFHDNIQTRILEKDYFVPSIPFEFFR